MNKYRVIELIGAVSLAVIMMVSCGKKTEPAKVSDNAGIGREDIVNMSETNIDDPSDSKTESGDETKTDDGQMWSYKDGKYTFNFKERDKSAEKDLSDIASLRGVALDDQPDDWYFGKSTYDESTGEVTYIWDRSQNTIDTCEQYGAIYRGDTERKVIYITFDCGYEYGTTASILDTLKEKQVSSIFFVTGAYVKSEHALMERMLNEGHIIGNHTVNHLRASTLSGEDLIKELENLEDMFYEQFPDAEPLIFYRPPYGNCDKYVLALTHKMGYHTVLWSYTYMDYDTDNQISYTEAMNKVKGGLHPGAVYLFHAESKTNAAILGDFIDWVREQGYEILPVCDIIQQRGE